MKHLLFGVVVVGIAALSRLLPHPPNVTPLAALALTGALYLDRRFAFILPLAAMLISDVILGVHRIMPFVYVSFAVIAAVGLLLRSRRSVPVVAGATIGGSVLFFIVTNFGVWFVGEGGAYPKTAAGLLECYVAAIPFFRNTLLGDLAYVAILSSIFEMSRRWIPSWSAPLERQRV